MSIQITESTRLRLWAAVWLVVASGGSISTFILTQYPADKHPVAKGIAVFFGILGLIGLAGQAQSKPVFHSEGDPAKGAGRGPGFPLASVLLAFVLLPLAFGQFACDQSQIQKAINASDRVVELCDRGERVVADLKAGGLIDSEDADRLAPLVRDVRASGLELGSVARALKGDEPDVKARIRSAVVALADAAGRLEAEGVLRVKNEKTREKLRKVLAVARIGVDVGL